MKTSNQQIVLSGIKPSGELHIGNYLGWLANCLKLQNDYQCYFFIATYHSMTENFNAKEKREQINEMAIDFLASGLDPKKCIIFNQADVPECTELTWIFNCITPISELFRMTQYKDKSVKQAKSVNAGLLDYPVLQAADILLYHGDLVPIGQDQIQHLELTSDVAKWYNNKFGEYFKIPKPLFTKIPKVMSLAEPDKKMSKSGNANSYIAIKEEPEVIRKKFQRAVTGTGQEETLPLGAQNLLLILEEFAPEAQVKYFKDQISKKTIKYSELKTALAEIIIDHFAPYRAKRKELEAKPEYVKKVLQEGAQKAQIVARKTIKEVKEMLGLSLT